jgi:hypothetical protein
MVSKNINNSGDLVALSRIVDSQIRLTRPSELTERHDENKRAADLRSLAEHLGISEHPSSLRGCGGTRPRSQIKKAAGLTAFG